MTTHRSTVVLDLCSLIWGFGNQPIRPKMGSIDIFIFVNLQLVGCNFSGLEVRGCRGQGVPAHRFLLVPIDTYGLSLSVFELFRLLKKAFSSIHPSDLGYDDNYHTRSY